MLDAAQLSKPTNSSHRMKNEETLRSAAALASPCSRSSQKVGTEKTLRRSAAQRGKRNRRRTVGEQPGPKAGGAS